MPREHESRRRPGAVAALCAGILCLLPALYVLSIGPFVWLVERGFIDDESQLGIVYAPLGLLVEAMPALEELLESYIACWQ